MVAIAIVSADPIVRRDLARALGGHSGTTAVSAVEDMAAVSSLIEQEAADIILVDSPSPGQLTAWRGSTDGEPIIIAIVDGPAGVEAGRTALRAGADAILARSADGEEVMAAVNAVRHGLAVLPQALLPALLDAAGLDEENGNAGDRDHARLTARELEVLRAVANGASNKAIARRLGISIHTVKFHLAAILTKLDAESRTEAVTRAAQLGLVML
jgi:DNA-binding NarL/FixJ family response regulator